MALRRELATTPQSRSDLAGTYDRMAEALALLGRTGEATDAQQQAAAIRRDEGHGRQSAKGAG